MEITLAKVLAVRDKIAQSDASRLPKKALSRSIMQYLASSDQGTKDGAGQLDYVIYEEALRELNMLNVLLNVGGSGPGSEPDFFYKEIGLASQLDECTKQMGNLPVMGLKVAEVDASELMAAMAEILAEDKGGYNNSQTDVNGDGEDDDESDDDEDDQTPPKPKTEYPDNEDDEEDVRGKKLKELVRTKSGDSHELADDLQTISIKQKFVFSNQGKRKREDYHPTAEELALINSSESGIDLTPQDIFVYNLESADMNIDRQNERFTEPALKKMAMLSVDKAFLVDHNWSTEFQLGKIFAATYKDGKLLQKVYVLNDPMNDRYNKNIMAGIFNKVSVGFASNLKDMECSACGDGMSIYDSACPHMPGGQDDKGVRTHINIKDVSDYYEVSLVPIPAQRDAGIRRNSLDAKSLETSPAPSRRRSITITPEMLEAWERGNSQTFAQENIENKNLDTINGGNNHLGDESVPNTTTSPNTDNTVEAKTADVFITPDQSAAPVADAQTSEGTATPAPDANVELSTQPDAAVDGGAETVITTPEVAPAAPETVEDKSTAPQATENDQKPKSKLRKTLKKTVKNLQQLVESMQALVNEQKNLAASTQQVELAMKAQDEKLKALTDIVEAATKVSVESIERNVAAKAAKNSATNGGGNEWAVDLTKRLLGGNQ